MIRARKALLNYPIVFKNLRAPKAGPAVPENIAEVTYKGEIYRGGHSDMMRFYYSKLQTALESNQINSYRAIKSLDCAVRESALVPPEVYDLDASLVRQLMQTLLRLEIYDAALKLAEGILRRNLVDASAYTEIALAKLLCLASGRNSFQKSVQAGEYLLELDTADSARFSVPNRCSDLWNTIIKRLGELHEHLRIGKKHKPQKLKKVEQLKFLIEIIVGRAMAHGISLTYRSYYYLMCVSEAERIFLLWNYLQTQRSQLHPRIVLKVLQNCKDSDHALSVAHQARELECWNPIVATTLLSILNREGMYQECLRNFYTDFDSSILRDLGFIVPQDSNLESTGKYEPTILTIHAMLSALLRINSSLDNIAHLYNQFSLWLNKLPVSVATLHKADPYIRITFMRAFARHQDQPDDVETLPDAIATRHEPQHRLKGISKAIEILDSLRNLGHKEALFRGYIVILAALRRFGASHLVPRVVSQMQEDGLSELQIASAHKESMTTSADLKHENGLSEFSESSHCESHKPREAPENFQTTKIARSS